MELARTAKPLRFSASASSADNGFFKNLSHPFAKSDRTGRRKCDKPQSFRSRGPPVGWTFNSFIQCWHSIRGTRFLARLVIMKTCHLETCHLEDLVSLKTFHLEDLSSCTIGQLGKNPVGRSVRIIFRLHIRATSGNPEQATASTVRAAGPCMVAMHLRHR